MDGERDDAMPGASTGATRRQLLSAATGGFALASSGLFLPAVLQDAQAREGAQGGENGGRRGKDHKGRHRKRTHGKKKDQGANDRPLGARWSLIRYVAFRAENRDNDPDMSVDFYFRVKGDLSNFGPLVYARSVDPFPWGYADYAPERYSIGAYFRGPALPIPVFVEVRNGLAMTPWAKVQPGSTIDSSGNVVGGYTVKQRDGSTEWPLDEGDYLEIDLGKGFANRNIKFQIRRLSDSDTQKWYRPAIFWT